MCGFCFGFAAQRGTLCVVSGITEVIEHRSPRLFVSFFRISLWVLLPTLPVCWLNTAAHRLMIYSPSPLTIVGGLLFGLGAAVNGGCSFGTLIRFAAGDLSFIASFVGMAAGVWSQRRMSMLAAPMPNGPSVLAYPSPFGILVLSLVTFFSIRELVLLHHWKRAGSWSPEKAAVAVGLCGGLLYVLNGPWFYTIAFDHLVHVSGAGQLHGFELTVITFAILAGAAISARRNQMFHLRFQWKPLPLHIMGGAAMGFGAALIPGGNAVVVLNAFPALSPHAAPAYFSIILGAGMALFTSRFLRRATHFSTPARIMSEATPNQHLSRIS